jgi:DNA primase
MRFDIEDYARTHLDRFRLTSTGEITATCPFCERFGAFYVNKATGNYICFKCNERGRRMVGVIAQVEGCTKEQANALLLKQSVEFARKETPQSLMARIKCLRDDEYVVDDEDKIQTDLPSEYVPVYKDGAWRYPTYLKQRGINRKTARAWKLGYCNDGRYGGRIVIPIECPAGHSFVARDVTGTQQPKVLNPPGPGFNRMLLGWPLVPMDSDFALVEGPFDAMKWWQWGIPVMAMLGKVLHSAQLKQLFQRPSRCCVTVALDPEEKKAPYDVANQLTCRFKRVHIAHLPVGIDPGDSNKKQALMAYNQSVWYKGNPVESLVDKIAATRVFMEKRFV